MKMNDIVDGVRSTADRVDFVRALVADLESQPQPQAWENVSLDRYLEALASWLEDADGFYRNQGREIPHNPTWTSVADMLIAASMYE
jgi:hypothetical protein